MNYKADDMVIALARAQWLSRKTGQPISIIDRNGRLDTAKTIVESDKVVVKGVMAPRNTAMMIETGCEAQQEIMEALPYVQRAAAIIKQKYGTDIEAEEIMADLMKATEVWADMDRTHEERIARDSRPSFFTRLFGRGVVPMG